jgi:hypothetical protein
MAGHLATASLEEWHTNYHKMKTVLRIQVWDVMLREWTGGPRGMLNTEDDGRMLGTVPNNTASPQVSKIVF